ncbi:protein kinase [Streptomyces sp. NPDC050560]|uniref:serine/threonine-protein kinase n=1 Tax=Streptomyces sp. NPDC050560 TaxID=3365630 RepID=UPI00378B92E0
MQPLDPGEPAVIGPYRLLGRLGSGGMGRVYLGHGASGRTVAVKSVHPHFALDEEFRARFRREVAAARKVGGAWTAPVLDADPDAPLPWVATGYVAGPSLTEAVGTGDRLAPLPERAVRVLGAGLAEALAHVHALGLVHRDVKPSNVLLTVDGPRLIDFGVARALDGTTTLTATGASIGSPGYMAPEQILGQDVTGAADVFSLGAVLVYAATGRPPFPGDSSAALLYHVVHEPPTLHGLGGDLHDVVARCLAKEPGDRPAPAELSALLVPEGAQTAVAAGWLPGPVIAMAVRALDQVVNLERPGPDTPAPGANSAATPAQPHTPAPGANSAATPAQPHTPAPGANGAATPAQPHTPAPGANGAATPAQPHTPPPDGTPPPAAGVFGPPDPWYGAPHPPAATGAAAQDATPQDAAGTEPARGRISGSLAARVERGPDGRRRGLSCTVALGVAAALAAVTVGSMFAFDLLPGDDDNPPTGAQPPASHGPTTAGTPPSDGNGGDGAVPAAYLGTWSGEATATLNGSPIPSGHYKLSLRQAGTGEQVGTLVETDIAGGTCTDLLTLTKANAEELTATGAGDKGNDAHCSQAEHTIHLTPKGDDLQFTSDDPGAGDPKAKLSKEE